MDPNANLEELRELCEAIQTCVDAELPIEREDAARAAELVLALDGWLSKGGALPKAWAWNRATATKAELFPMGGDK